MKKNRIRWGFYAGTHRVRIDGEDLELRQFHIEFIDGPSPLKGVPGRSEVWVPMSWVHRVSDDQPPLPRVRLNPDVQVDE